MRDKLARQEYESRIHRVLDYLDQHLGEEITLTTMAGEACFSPFHFHRIFTSLIGETPADYLRRLRLERAAVLLMAHDALSVTEIGLCCGFSSLSAFTRAFKAHFGVAPHLFRTDQSKNCQPLRKPGQAGIEALPYNGNQGMTEDFPRVSVKSLPEFTILYRRYLGGYNQGIGQAWAKLYRWAGARDLLSAGSQAIGIPLDNPEITPVERCRYLVGLTVSDEKRGLIKPAGGIGLMVIPGGRYAVYPFAGPETAIAGAYRTLYGVWLPGSGYQPKDQPSLEIYSGSQPANGVFRYDICLPVQPL